MRPLLTTIVLVLVGATFACSSGSSFDQAAQQNSDQQQSQDGINLQPSGGGDAVPPGPVGPADVDTIRVGDQAWGRTLPMTSGQCFVQRVEGLPVSGVAWGSLNGDDELSFAANYNQDGSFEAEVRGPDMFWIAGARSPGVQDLAIELDFEALTIIGSGTFTSLHTNELAAGSFHFQCEERVN